MTKGQSIIFIIFILFVFLILIYDPRSGDDDDSEYDQ